MLLDYFTRIIAALSQLLNTLGGGHQNESISSRAYRAKWTKVEEFINLLIFWEYDHCKKSFKNDLNYCIKFVKDNKE